MSILCWVDAGPAFGLGHVSRGLALAEALGERGRSCRFALPDDPTALGWLRAARARQPLVLADREPPLPAVLAAAAHADAVVVDVRRALARPEVRALAGGRPVLVVDNTGPGIADADLVLAPFGQARDRRWLAGAAFVPLRRAFRLAADLRGLPHAPPLVLVTMGASDPGGLAVPVLEGLHLARESGARFTGRVVANPLAPVWERLPGLLRRLDFPPACAIHPGAMPSHLAEADVAVVAMGVTVYEAMACGVPAVVLARTSADVAHARALARRGAVASLGLHWREDDVARTVAALVADPARRAAMARAGRALVDGRGAERVADRLLALLEEGRPAHAGASAR
jgi:spore coat polysaccharide biosynthesis predicted glycosyltransferase SpsG